MSHTMTWFLISFLTALCSASQDAWIKKHFSGLSVYEMAAYPLFYSLPLFFFSLAFITVPKLDAIFYGSFAVSLPLNALSFILYMQAIRISPLSLTVPFLAFTPTFIIFTGYVFLDEMPNWWGIVGILMTCAGAYVINIDTAKWSPLAPLLAVFKETGSWLMLIVSFLFSFAAVIGKVGMLHSSPLFFTMMFFGVFGFSMLSGMLLFRKIRLQTFGRHRLKGTAAGLLFYFHALFHCLAIILVKAAYMISIKRLSVLIGVIYGGVFFHERHVVIRFWGSLLMISGAFLIAVLGV